MKFGRNKNFRSRTFFQSIPEDREELNSSPSVAAPKRKNRMDQLRKLNCRSRTHQLQLQMDNDSQGRPQSTTDGSLSAFSSGSSGNPWEDDCLLEESQSDRSFDPFLNDDSLVRRHAGQSYFVGINRLGTVDEENDETTEGSRSEEQTQVPVAAPTRPSEHVRELALIADDDQMDDPGFFPSSSSTSSASQGWALEPSPRELTARKKRGIKPLSASAVDTPSFLHEISDISGPVVEYPQLFRERPSCSPIKRGADVESIHCTDLAIKPIIPNDEESQISGYEQDSEDLEQNERKSRAERPGSTQKPSRGNSPVVSHKERPRSRSNPDVVMAARDFLALMEKRKKEEAEKQRSMYYHQVAEESEDALAENRGGGRLYQHLLTHSPKQRSTEQLLSENSMSSFSCLETDEESALQGIGYVPSISLASPADLESSLDLSTSAKQLNAQDPLLLDQPPPPPPPPPPPLPLMTGAPPRQDEEGETSSPRTPRSRAIFGDRGSPAKKKSPKLQGLISMFEGKNTDIHRLNDSMSSPSPCDRHRKVAPAVVSPADDDNDILNLPVDNRLSPAGEMFTSRSIHIPQLQGQHRHSEQRQQASADSLFQEPVLEDRFSPHASTKSDSKSPRDSRYPVPALTRKDTGLPPFAPPVHYTLNDFEGISDTEEESLDRFSLYSSTEIQGYRIPGADEI